MAQTIADAVTQVRDIVQDSKLPYRNSDTIIFQYLNSALSDVHRHRPDLFIGALDEAFTLYTEADIDEPFPIDHTYFTAIVDFIVGMIAMRDDEFVADGRAEIVLNRFIAKLKGKVA